MSNNRNSTKSQLFPHSMELPSLYEAFWQTLDASKVLFDTKEILRNPKLYAEKLLGVGAHFEAYLPPTTPEPLYVLKIAQKEKLRQSVNLSEWMQIMLTIKGAQVGVIPPFELFNLDEHVLLVMPRAVPIPRRQVIADSQIQNKIAETKAYFAGLGVTMFDQWQIGLVKNIPILVDLSDLRVSKPRGVLCGHPSSIIF